MTLRSMPDRSLVFLLSSLCLSVLSAPAQDTRSATAGKPDLKLTVMCNGNTKHGHATGCRVYQASDGTEGEITYTFEAPLSQARQDLADWRKALRTVTSHEENVTRNGVKVSERYTGMAEAYPSHQTVYMILLRREGRCFFIQSSSAQIAAQIEDWFEH